MAKPTSAPVPKPKAISVRQRRIAEGARNQTRVVNATLVNQPVPMVTRWFNSEIDGRIPHATDELGWVPVAPAEVAGGLSGTMQDTNGQVTRAGGREILMKMPAAEYKQILLARELRSDKAMKSEAKTRQRTAEMMAQHGHESGADRVMGSGLEIHEFDASTPDRVELEPV